MSRTKSHSPFSQTWSRMSSQISAHPSLARAHRLGVNPSLTRRRRLWCSGASMSIIMGNAGKLGRIPPALENVSRILRDVLQVPVPGDPPDAVSPRRSTRGVPAHPGEGGKRVPP